MSEGGEARCEFCGLPFPTHTDECEVWKGTPVDPALDEGGEARNHEAEVAAAIFDVLAREGVTFNSRLPIGRSQVQAFRYRVAKAIAALDAVRRSPDDLEARQRDIDERNLAWLRKHHPNDPRVRRRDSAAEGQPKEDG